MLNNKTINFPFGHSDMQELRAYDASDRLEYVGRAHPGTAVTAAQWQISKYTYDAATERITSIKFAGGVNDYTSVWNDRATYTYA